jgi:DNA-directed RNA polymerase subunit RPC12/RpoP
VSARTGIRCPNCDYDDSRIFKTPPGYITYVCPKCSHLWDEKEPEKDKK